MVYCTSLENWRCASIPGFESQSLRFGGKTMNIGAFFMMLRGISESKDRDDETLVKDDDFSDITILLVVFLIISIVFLTGVLYIILR